MSNEFQTPDPQSIWQNQPTEPFIMSADQLRYKAAQLQRKARFKTALSIILGIALFIFFGKQTLAGGDLVPRLGLGLITGWCLFFVYQAYHWTWPNALAQDATLSTTLHSYRTQLERRSDYARHIWRRAGLPFCFLGLALFALPGIIQSLNHPALLINFAPLISLLAIWLVAFYLIRRSDRRKLTKEIEELRAFEKANAS